MSNSGYSSRTKRMLTIALNKQLQNKICSSRIAQNGTKTRESDPDYSPDDLSGSESSTSSCSDTEIAPSPKKKKDDIDSSTTKINILQNIVLQSVGQDDNDNDNTPNCFRSSTIINNEETTFAEEYISSILTEMITEVMNIADAKLYKKDGSLRKRKKYDEGPIQRKNLKREKYKKEHFVQRACNCQMKCFTKIKHARQLSINQQFWQMSKNEQNMFLNSCIKKSLKKRHTSKDNDRKRTYTYTYSLNNEQGEAANVCKVFLLATLGFKKENDRILKRVRSINPSELKPKPDRRGHPSSKKIYTTRIIKHINSFGPTISHYRREHAPHRKYLPSDISITYMYENFKNKYGANFSYELYRKVVADMNISFANLGNEECWNCEEYRIHKESRSCHENGPVCDICRKYVQHKAKATEAREEYKKDSTKLRDSEELIVSADLQKVIMLPRLDTFKEIIFTPRIIVFNESFVPVGAKSDCNPWAVIWHEGIAGRSMHDIISTFYAFLLANRDVKTMVIWLDNCASQNKNWTLISFCIYILNSNEVALEKLALKYFEPGHTFMSADSFHHQVELSLKKKKKVYDFADFKDSVQNANSRKFNVLEMGLNNFFTFTDYTSKQKLQKLRERIYLKDICQINFERGSKFFFYKNKYSDILKPMNDIFLAKYVNYELSQPKQRDFLKGITLDRKNNLISKLKNHIPPNRLLFWENLPVSEGSDNSEEL